MPPPTWIEIAGLGTMLTAALGMLGRGVIWFVQWQSAHTTNQLKDELEWVYAELHQCEDRCASLEQRLRALGLTP